MNTCYYVELKRFSGRVVSRIESIEIGSLSDIGAKYRQEFPGWNIYIVEMHPDDYYELMAQKAEDIFDLFDIEL